METPFSQVIEALPGLVWTSGPDGLADYLNRRWREYTGLGLDEAGGLGWLASVHPEDRAALGGVWRALLASGEAGEAEARLRRLDGAYRWFRFQASPLADQAGRVVGWCGVNTDIEDRRRAEQAVKRQERQFRSIVEGLPSLVFVMTPDGEIEHANRRHLDYFGEDPSTLPGRGALLGVHPDDRARALAAWTTAEVGERPCDFEARRRGLDGSYRWFRSRGFPLRDELGRLTGWYVEQTDIEASRHAEALLSGERCWLEMIASGCPLPDILDALCRFVEGALENSYCSVLLIDPDRSVFRVGASPSLPASYLRTKDGQPVEADRGPCGMAAVLQAQVIVTDVAFETRWDAGNWQASTLAHGLKSCWSTPIRSEARTTLGTFSIYQPTPGVPQPLHQQLIQRLTHIASIAISRERSETSLKRAFEDLKRSERRLCAILDTIPTSAWGCGADGAGAFFWNQRWRDYAGFAPEEGEGSWVRAAHPDDLPGMLKAWDASLASGQSGEVEVRLRRFDGAYRWFLSRWEPMRDETGKVLSWYGANTDIHHAKLAEALLEGAKGLLEQVASGASMSDVLDALCRFVEAMDPGAQCGVLFFAPDGATWRQALGSALPSGYVETMIGRPAHSASGPCGLAAALKAPVIVADVATDPRWAAHGWRDLALSHGLRSCWSSPVLSENRTALGALAVYRREPGVPTPFQEDLIRQATHIASIAIRRARSEEALRRSEDFLAQAQRLTRTGSLWWTGSPGEIAWSEEAYRLLQYPRATTPALELIYDRWHPEDRPALREMIEQSARDGSNLDFEHRLLLPDGAIRHVRVVVQQAGLSGEPGWSATITDISDRKQAEEDLGQARSELAHMARVLSLSALTASIAHEVNQPLSGIITNASTCLRMLGADPPNIAGALETARRTIRDGARASEVITRLRALFARKSPARETVDLNAAVREVIALSSSDLRRLRVTLRADLAKDLPPLLGDRVQLQQVLLNLLANASDALSAIEDRPRRVVVRTYRDGEDQVGLSVQDNGVGFGAGAAGKLFDAFYTTKASGMGIGLSVSRSIVERHGGRLWASENSGPGVSFSVCLPHAAALAGDADPDLAVRSA